MLIHKGKLVFIFRLIDYEFRLVIIGSYEEKKNNFLLSFYDDFSIRPKPRAIPAARLRRAPKVNLLLRRQKLDSTN